MKLSWFLIVLALIALVASVFSPSTIGIATGSQGELTNSQTGLTSFISLMQREGYTVRVANTSQQELSYAKTSGAVFFLIDPDTAINSTLAQTLFTGYRNGSISLVLAEGNSTNEAPLLAMLGARVTGAAIKDPASTFADQRIFDITMNLGTPTIGEIDVGSPIILNSSGSLLRPVAESSSLSVDAQNTTAGPRTVIAATSSDSSARAILISSSSPFTNCGLSQCTNLNDTALDISIAAWASAGNSSRLVVIDASHYVASTPPLGLGIPVGWVMLILLKGLFSYIGGSGLGAIATSGTGLTILGHVIPPEDAVAIEVGIAVMLLLFIRNRLTAWFSPEKTVKDDLPLQTTEQDFASESKERQDFLSASRDKSFYVATLGQLYGVLDDVVRLEFGAGIADLSVESLTERLGPEKAAKAHAMLSELSRYFAYYSGHKGRFILPPGLSWKRKVASMTTWAEEFVNDLGITMAGKEGGRQIEYLLKR